MTQQKLIQSAYKVIKEEGLPEPKYIRYRYPKTGVRRIEGSCHKHKGRGEYWIILSVIGIKYTEDKNGSYTNKRTKIKFSGKLIHYSIEKLTKNMAHEIAHLKFWNHGPEHNSYTNYILSKLNIHLNSDGGR